MNTILIGDVIEKIKDIPGCSVNTCVTSPPYWGLRDYGEGGQIGLEETPEQYVEKMVKVFREVRRVLRDDGTLWLNLGDSYSAAGHGWGCGSISEERKQFEHIGGKKKNRKPAKGLKHKDLVGIPWRVAFALQADGWYLRQDIIWAKPNPMPESVKDRCTKAHEYIFLLSKSPKYYYDHEAIKEPAAYLQANSPESIKSPYAQNVKKYKGNANGFRGGAYCNGNKGNSELGRRTQTGNNVTGNYPGRDDKGKNCNSPEQITRNKRSVWTVATKPFPGSHFATFPPELIEPCIKAGAPMGGTVLDPFFGAGTTGLVAYGLSRKYIGIELNPEYAEMAENRIKYGTVKEEELAEEKAQMQMNFEETP